jgi:apolipoprotein N-acyltransferase
VEGLRGWRRSALAVVLGIALSATLPPIHALPLLPIALTGFLWLIASARSPAAGFVAGFWFGLGHFVSGFYWFGFALMTDPGRFGWLVGPAVLGISAGLALLPALVALIVRLLPLGGVWRVAAFALLWTGAEYFRGHALSGFPWNLVGTAWALSQAMSQVVALLGSYGLSLLTVLSSALPAAGALQPARRPGRALLGGLGLLAALFVGGTLRLAFLPDDAADGPLLRLVQPNTAQRVKWQPEQQNAILRRLIALSNQPGERPRVVIWPEAAVPFAFGDAPDWRAALAGASPGAFLITGAPRRGTNEAGEPAAWNSLYVLLHDGTMAARYDKHHLVPFGEYVPLRALLPVTKLTAGSLDFTAGPGPQTLAVPGLPAFSPLICYEAIFPGGVLDDKNRPAWLLNLTNDGWFGLSSGPYQHAASARLRAIEEGLPLVRVANTGISALFDAEGRIVARLGLGQGGVLDVRLPPPLPHGTLYGWWRDWPLIGMLCLGAVALAWRIRQKGR